MGFFSWILFGFVVGLVAKIVFPGQDGGGWIKTILIGIVGSFVGGFLGSLVGYGTSAEWSMEGFGTAIIGAIVILALNRLVTKS